MPTTNDPPIRERGTLAETIPKSPLLILLLLWIVNAAFGTLIYHLSVTQTNNDDWVNILLTFFKVGLGSLCTLMGVVYSNPSTFGLFFGYLHFINLILPSSILSTKDIQASVQIVALPLIASLLTRSKLFSKLCNPLGSSFLVNYINITLGFLLPFIYIVINCSYNTLASDGSKSTFLSLPIIIFGIFGIVVYKSYVSNLAHNNGSLFNNIGSSVVIGISILVAVSLSTTDEQKSTSTLLMLLGAASASIMCVFYAAVADVWYPFGTGQFQMISLDTSALIFYVILPVSILLHRFFLKYGLFMNGLVLPIARVIVRIVESSGGKTEYFTKIVNESPQQPLIIFLTVIIVVGVPLVNNYCPLAGYLYGRVYTHGQPSKKNVALCVQFSDLYNINSTNQAIFGEMDKRLKKWKVRKEKKNNEFKKSVLNIFVSKHDLIHSAKDIQNLRKEGHSICLRIDSPKDLVGTYDKYVELLGDQPEWCLGLESESSSPEIYILATKMKLRVALWSIRIMIGDRPISTPVIEAIDEEVGRKDGGSFIFVKTTSDAVESEVITESMNKIFDKLEHEGFYLTTLNDTAKKDKAMILK